jgi:hypothetical protein
MLPNLSTLNARTLPVEGPKRTTSEAELDQPNNPDTRTRVSLPLHKIDWDDVFDRQGDDYDREEYERKQDLPEELKFVVSIPRAGLEPFKIEFTLKDEELTIETRDGKKHKCIKADMYYSSSHIDSLFFSIDNELLSQCSIEPDPMRKESQGYGAAVLQALDAISIARKGGNGIIMSLADVALFRDETEPVIHAGYYITPTLVLRRGMGYYEARGFISAHLVAAEKDTSKYAAHTRVDLEWSHMIATTPIMGLPEAIRGFYARVLELGTTVPEFTRTLYSQSFCEAHALRTEALFLSAWRRTMLPRIKDTAFAYISMRALAFAFEKGLVPKESFDDLSLNMHVATLMNNIWTRPLEINPTNGIYVRTYPGMSLKKQFYAPADGGTLQFNAIVPNPINPGRVPVVQLQQVRTDLTVEFINTDAVRIAV